MIFDVLVDVFNCIPVEVKDEGVELVGQGTVETIGAIEINRDRLGLVASFRSRSVIVAIMKIEDSRSPVKDTTAT